MFGDNGEKFKSSIWLKIRDASSTKQGKEVIGFSVSEGILFLRKLDCRN